MYRSIKPPKRKRTGSMRPRALITEEKCLRRRMVRRRRNTRMTEMMPSLPEPRSVEESKDCNTICTGVRAAGNGSEGEAGGCSAPARWI